LSLRPTFIRGQISRAVDACYQTFTQNGHVYSNGEEI